VKTRKLFLEQGIGGTAKWWYVMLEERGQVRTITDGASREEAQRSLSKEAGRRRMKQRVDGCGSFFYTNRSQG